MIPKDVIPNWIENELDNNYISGNRWDGHKTFWLQVTREDEVPGTFSYNLGYEGKKGKWVTLTNKRFLTREQLMYYVVRVKKDYDFNHF